MRKEGFVFPLVGPTYTSSSLPVGAQVTRNFYLEANPQGSEPVCLKPFPGLKAFTETGVGVNRGMGVFNNKLYTITGQTLYEVAANSTTTSIGTILGIGRCSLISDGYQLVIAIGTGKPYTYDGTTLTQGIDIDLPSPATVAFLNSRVVYDGVKSEIVFADLNSPLDVNSANITTAETHPDDILAVVAYKSQVYAFGSESIEPYYATGSGNPPYAPITNATISIGLHAIHSAKSNKNYLYFLGSDLMIYRIGGLQVQSIGNPAITQEIRKYTTTEDAYAVCFTLDSQDFYMISFPTAGATWLFSEQTTQWVNLAYGTDGGQHLISDYQYVFGKHLVADRRNGNIYELDFETYTDNGDVIQRLRDTISIDSKVFGFPGRYMTLNKLTLYIEPGVSSVTEKAVVVMQISSDNGNTWSTERWAHIGEQGDYSYELTWRSLGRFKDLMFRFFMSDPVKWVLLRAECDLEISIG